MFHMGMPDGCDTPDGSCTIVQGSLIYIYLHRRYIKARRISGIPAGFPGLLGLMGDMTCTCTRWPLLSCVRWYRTSTVTVLLFSGGESGNAHGTDQAKGDSCGWPGRCRHGWGQDVCRRCRPTGGGVTQGQGHGCRCHVSGGGGVRCLQVPWTAGVAGRLVFLYLLFVLSGRRVFPLHIGAPYFDSTRYMDCCSHLGRCIPSDYFSFFFFDLVGEPFENSRPVGVSQGHLVGDVPRSTKRCRMFPRNLVGLSNVFLLSCQNFSERFRRSFYFKWNYACFLDAHGIVEHFGEATNAAEGVEELLQ